MIGADGLCFQVVHGSIYASTSSFVSYFSNIQNLFQKNTDFVLMEFFFLCKKSKQVTAFLNVFKDYFVINDIKKTSNIEESIRGFAKENSVTPKIYLGIILFLYIIPEF